MGDDTPLQILKEAINAFVGEGDWERFHKPTNLVSSIAIGASELLEIFQWEEKSREQIKSDVTSKKCMEEELADVIIYCLSLANVLEIDGSSSVLSKIEKNETKYPDLINLSKSKDI